MTDTPFLWAYPSETSAAGQVTKEERVFDLKIEDVRICDGLGNPIEAGEVAVKDGRIVSVGEASGPARETVDGDGLVLAPGFVDVHTHYDAQITWDRTATPSPAHGVTTVVIGNCGFSIAPCRTDQREITLKNLTKVEGIPYKALAAGVNWTFETFDEYLNSLETGGVTPNIACFAGHSAIRTYVMGDDARRRAATDVEIDTMCGLLGDALDAGAIGFSTSLFELHNGDGGYPMPSRLAENKELLALARVLKEKDKGTLQVVRGNALSIEALGEIAEDIGRPVQMSAITTAPGFPEIAEIDICKVETIRARGVELWAHVTPYPEIMLCTLKNPFPMESIHAWKPVMEADGQSAMRRLYEDAAFRQSVKDELRTPVPFRFNGQWNVVEVVSVADRGLRGYVGCTIAEIAETEGKDPFDACLDIALRDNLATCFRIKTLNYEEEKVRPLLDHACSVISLSDAGAHLTFFCQAGIGLYLLQRYVRERGDMELIDAIRLLTSRPADTHRIPDRGRIAIGAWADLLLFDPDTAGVGADTTVNDLPGGLSRIDTPPLGVAGVWVNGVRIVDEQGLIKETPLAGQVIRAFAP